LFSYYREADFSQFRNNSFLFEEGLIHPSFKELAVVRLSKESVNKIYRKPLVGRIRETQIAIPDDDTPLIEGLRKKKSTPTCIGSSSNTSKGYSKKSQAQRVPSNCQPVSKRPSIPVSRGWVRDEEKETKG